MRLSRPSATCALVFLAFLAACESSSSSPNPQTDVPAVPDGGPEPVVPSTCAAETGAGTKHSSVTGDETWTAAASPHVIETSIDIPAGKTLTLEPCAVVQVGARAGILVEGTIAALGAADKRIAIGRADTSASWTNIEAREGSSVKLAYVTIDGGGNPNGSDPASVAMLDIRGTQDEPAQGVLAVDHVTLSRSESLGLLVREGGGFAEGSQALTITGSASFPALVWGRSMRAFPSGTYTGNATDEIVLPGIGGYDDIEEDTTLANVGVPYRIGRPTGGGSLVVSGTGSAPLLTLAAGVTLRFEKNGRLYIDGDGSGNPHGALRIEGTDAAPVVLTSAAATPAAGDWVGIIFKDATDPRTKIDHAKIAYVGADSGFSSFGCTSPGAPSFGNAGGIIFAGGKPPAGAVTNTTISDSAGEGIVRGWTGDEVDLLATNTFTNIVRCNQTMPKPQSGVCPEPAACPR